MPLMRITVLFACIPILLASGQAVADGVEPTDRVWIQAPPDKPVNYVISPGMWTFDNEVIDVTFGQGGKLDVPAGEKGETEETVKLPFAPNDFFFGPDIITVGSYQPIEYWAKVYWNNNLGPASAIVPLLRLPKEQPPGKSVAIQIVYESQTRATLWLWVNPPFDPNNPFAWDKELADWKGPLSEALDPNFEIFIPQKGPIIGHHGVREAILDPSAVIPTVSEWGLIILFLLLLTAGTLILRRSMLEQQAVTT